MSRRKRSNRSWPLHIWLPLLVLCIGSGLLAFQLLKYEPNSLLGYAFTGLAFSIFLLLFEHI